MKHFFFLVSQDVAIRKRSGGRWQHSTWRTFPIDGSLRLSFVFILIIMIMIIIIIIIHRLWPVKCNIMLLQKRERKENGRNPKREREMRA